MHKKLEADLISLAHGILQMKNRDDVFALEKKAKQVSEKISMLAFIETYVNTTPSLEVTKEELITKVNVAFEEKYQEPVLESVPEVEEVSNTELTEVFKEEVKVVEAKEVKEELESPAVITLEEELKGTISVDQMATLFDAPPVSLNDKLVSNIQIGLNDRITFVKHLFDNNQEDFNRVISQLNSFKNKQEATQFIEQMVKPDYDWSNEEEIESRFVESIQRKFL